MSRQGRYWIFFVIVAVGLALSWGQVGRKTRQALEIEPVLLLVTETPCTPMATPCAAVGRDRVALAEHVVERRDVGALGVRASLRLLELPRVAEQNDVSRRARHREHVQDRALGLPEAPEPLDSIGGVLIENRSQDIRIDNSLVRRLQKQWPGLCGELLARLEMQVEGDVG